MRNVIIYPGEEAWFIAEIPSLPGCISQGETRAEALANIREAAELYVRTLIEDGEAVPPEAVEFISIELLETA